MRIALATCAHHPGFIANDDAPLIEALAGRGCDAPQARWDDEDIDWAAFDGVVLRTTWDYMERLGEFLAWCSRVERVSRLLNPLAVVEANIRKTYLRDLERAGVAVVPTLWLHDGEAAALAGMIEEAGWGAGDVVLKPCVGAGASGMLRAPGSDTDRLAAHAKGELRHGPVLVQEWLGSIMDRGELSVVVIDGEVSHAVRKVPQGGEEFRVQIEFGGAYTPEEPGAPEREVALAAIEHAARAHHDGESLLYGRVDLVEVDGRPAVIELELIEPELFFPIVPGAADRFADALLQRLV